MRQPEPPPDRAIAGWTIAYALLSLFAGVGGLVVLLRRRSA